MRVSDLKLERAGKKLFEEFQSRDEFKIMVGEDSPSNMEEAYAIQEIYTDRKAKDAGGYCGYKIAYTTKVMQERVGATEPVYGRILANGLNRSPTVLKASDYVRIGVECEVAARKGDRPQTAHEKHEGCESDHLYEKLEAVREAEAHQTRKQNAVESPSLQGVVAYLVCGLLQQGDVDEQLNVR